MAGNASRKGAFGQKENNVLNIKFADFINPWNFYNLFLKDDSVVTEWLTKNGLLPNNIVCEKCGSDCTITNKPSKPDGKVWR